MSLFEPFLHNCRGKSYHLEEIRKRKRLSQVEQHLRNEGGISPINVVNKDD